MDDVNIVIFKQDTSITDTFTFPLLMFEAMFWLHIGWIEKLDKQIHKDIEGVIKDIIRIPSNPKILVVKTLYINPRILINIPKIKMDFRFFLRFN